MKLIAQIDGPALHLGAGEIDALVDSPFRSEFLDALKLFRFAQVNPRDELRHTSAIEAMAYEISRGTGPLNRSQALGLVERALGDNLVGRSEAVRELMADSLVILTAERGRTLHESEVREAFDELARTLISRLAQRQRELVRPESVPAPRETRQPAAALPQVVSVDAHAAMARELKDYTALQREAILARLRRVQETDTLLGDIKQITGGTPTLFEVRIHTRDIRIRVYFRKEGETLLLLGIGTKTDQRGRQQADIDTARRRYREWVADSRSRSTIVLSKD